MPGILKYVPMSGYSHERGLQVETVIRGKIAAVIPKGDAGLKIVIFLITLILIFILSFALGRYPVPPGQLLEVLAARVLPLEPNWCDTVETVIF